MINKAKCGWVVNSDRELAAAMENALNTKKEKLVELGKNGNDYALKELSKSSNLKKLINIFSE